MFYRYIEYRYITEKRNQIALFSLFKLTFIILRKFIEFIIPYLIQLYKL